MTPEPPPGPQIPSPSDPGLLVPASVADASGPGELPPDDKPADAPGPAGRAGRNLPAAIAVGVTLALAVVVPLFTVKAVFVAVVAAAVGLGVRELVAALRRGGVEPATSPLLVGGTIMLLLAYVDGAAGLVLGLLVTVVACGAWSTLAPPSRRPPSAPASSDVSPGGRPAVVGLGVNALIATYGPFCAGFAVLLAAPEDGALRVVVFIATVACSDIGGYAAGVLAGKHPMAPSVSPKKSWEGFGGSATACALAGSLLLPLLFGSPIWHGLLFGLSVVAMATLGDLGESMIKRDLGIKDMGSILPGHGGIMDRLDSLLPTAPVAWILLTASAPPGA